MSKERIRYSWLLLSAFVFVVALGMYFSVNWTAKDLTVPLIGGAVYYKRGNTPKERPTYFFLDERGTLRLNAEFKGVPGQDVYVTVAGANSADCTYQQASSLPLPNPSLAKLGMTFPTLPFADVARTFETLHVLPTGTNVIISCPISIRPLPETFDSSTIDFIPIEARSFALGKNPSDVYSAMLPENVVFSPSGATVVSVSGPSSSDPVASLINAYLVGDTTYHLRAKWVDNRREGLRSFITFLAATLTGLSAAFLIEWLRPMLDATFRRRRTR